MIQSSFNDPIPWLKTKFSSYYFEGLHSQTTTNSLRDQFIIVATTLYSFAGAALIEPNFSG